MAHTFTSSETTPFQRLRRQTLWFVISASVVFTAGCGGNQIKPDGQSGADVATVVSRKDTDKMFIVDCLLPAQVRRMGSSATYLAPRRAIKNSALDCEIRGGEYVALDRADYRTALKIWMAQANEGDAEAQMYVGEIYEKGLGTAPDYELAAIWYRRAAEQNYPSAQLALGYLYEKGLGVEQDLNEAMNWYRKASGLPDDIEFVSSIEISAQKEMLGELKKEIERLEFEADGLKQKLSSAQKRINKADEQSTSLSSELEKLQGELTDIKNTAPSDVVRALQNTIKDKEFALNKQQQLIAKLGKDVQRYNANLVSLENKQRQAAAAPSIELFDPLLRLTRGVPSVRMRSISRSQEVSGRISAPAGLSSFAINDTKVNVDEGGSFITHINIYNDETPVKMTALDERNRQASLEFVIKRPRSKTTKSAITPQKDIGKDVTFGKYYALVIGNNEYVNLPQLETATNDAQDVAAALRDNYGFKTTLLLNADRHQIVSALYQLREQLNESDNLLVYYAGHGDMDRVNDRGYWLPIDAEPDNPVNWISNVSITDMLNTIKAKHIMVVADSCYSGSMTSTAVARVDANIPTHLQEKWLKLMAKSRSRTVLTSGGVQPVLDGGGGSNSVFASAFLNALNNKEGIVQGYSLYQSVVGAVQKRAAELGVTQVPEYAPIKHAGHETGQFFFVPEA
ncbi:caspase family protein [Pseudomonadota bacterium]